MNGQGIAILLGSLFLGVATAADRGTLESQLHGKSNEMAVAFLLEQREEVGDWEPLDQAGYYELLGNHTAQAGQREAARDHHAKAAALYGSLLRTPGSLSDDERVTVGIQLAGLNDRRLAAAQEQEQARSRLIAQASVIILILLFSFLVTLVLFLRTQGRLNRQARRDRLTRLYNRSAILEIGDAAMRKARLAEHTLSVVVFDLDEFKQINEQHGHLVGDQVIQLAALAARRVVREVDSVGRLGGEEFLIILPAARKVAASEVADRIRRKVEKQPLVLDELPVHATLSLGVAEMGDADKGMHTLIKRADDALQDAKAQGRNRVCIAN